MAKAIHGGVQIASMAAGLTPLRRSSEYRKCPASGMRPHTIHETLTEAMHQ